jgi:hypothetical protein
MESAKGKVMQFHIDKREGKSEEERGKEER